MPILSLISSTWSAKIAVNRVSRSETKVLGRINPRDRVGASFRQARPLSHRLMAPIISSEQGAKCAYLEK